MRSLAATYFDIVRRSLCDAVPKALMHFLIARCGRGLQQRLIGELYREAALEPLTREREDVAAARERAGRSLAALATAHRALEALPADLAGAMSGGAEAGASAGGAGGGGGRGDVAAARPGGGLGHRRQPFGGGGDDDAENLQPLECASPTHLGRAVISAPISKDRHPSMTQAAFMAAAASSKLAPPPPPHDGNGGNGGRLAQRPH